MVGRTYNRPPYSDSAILVPLSEDIQKSSMKEYLMKPSEILSFYCSKTIVVSAKTRKSAEVTKNKVPGRPKLSSMF